MINDNNLFYKKKKLQYFLFLLLFKKGEFYNLHICKGAPGRRWGKGCPAFFYF